MGLFLCLLHLTYTLHEKIISFYRSEVMESEYFGFVNCIPEKHGHLYIVFYIIEAKSAQEIRPLSSYAFHRARL